MLGTFCSEWRCEVVFWLQRALATPLQVSTGGSGLCGAMLAGCWASCCRKYLPRLGGVSSSSPTGPSRASPGLAPLLPGRARVLHSSIHSLTHALRCLQGASPGTATGSSRGFAAQSGNEPAQLPTDVQTDSWHGIMRLLSH